MKRLLICLLVLAVFASLLSVTVSAAVYTEVYEYDFIDYCLTEGLGDSNGAVWFCYWDPIHAVKPTATSTMVMPDGGQGWVSAFIATHSEWADSSYSNVVVDGMVYAEISTPMGYATKTQHMATRQANGVWNAWDYTYISPNHNSDNEIERVIIQPKEES